MVVSLQAYTAVGKIVKLTGQKLVKEAFTIDIVSRTNWVL